MRVCWAAVVIGGILVAGCNGGSGGGESPTETVTPVVVLPAPIEVADISPSTAFQAEMTIMDGYEPLLKDTAGDALGGAAAPFDLVSAYAVATNESLLLRVQSSQPMTLDSRTDVRLWVEQGEKLLTVEAKPDHPERICELTPIGKSEGDELAGCLELNKTLDIRIPLESLPRWLDPAEAFFVSGVSTCCTDESRETPYDEIEGAQQVWVFDGEIPRVPPTVIAEGEAAAAAAPAEAAAAPAEAAAAPAAATVAPAEGAAASPAEAVPAVPAPAAP